MEPRPTLSDFDEYEFTGEVVNDLFEYQSWLEAAAQIHTLRLAKIATVLHAIPDFLRHIRGIAGPVTVDLDFSYSDGNPGVTSVSIATEDSVPIRVYNDNGLIIAKQGETYSIMPDNARDKIYASLFPEIHHNKDPNALVDSLKKQAPSLTEEFEYRGISENDISAVSIKLIQTESSDDSQIAVEIVSTDIHPSSALIGTRMNIHDALSLAEADIDPFPPSQVSLDFQSVHSGLNTTIESLYSDQQMTLASPKRSHGEKITEALFTLEQAARSRQDDSQSTEAQP